MSSSRAGQRTLITIEGLDGVGKSTVINSLPFDFPILAEPGSTALGQSLRLFLKGQVPNFVADFSAHPKALELLHAIPEASSSVAQAIELIESGSGQLPVRDPEVSASEEMYLFNVCRAQLMNEVIFPLLEETPLLIDRFIDSTVAYQGYGREGEPSPELVKQINSLATNGVTPDLTIYLKMDESQRQRRIGQRDGEVDTFDDLGSDFFYRVAAGFDALAAAEERIAVVDAAQPPEQVAAEVESLIRQTLP